MAGLVIPSLASVLPIRAALRKNLHDSLDTRRSKVHAVVYKLTRSEDSSFSWVIVSVGGALALFGTKSLQSLLLHLSHTHTGFLIYYVLPLALLSSNFALLLNIFFFIILGMLLGCGHLSSFFFFNTHHPHSLVLLALNLQPLLERYFAKLVFFWENVGVRALLVKNMIAHRRRNRKTTLMYSLSLAFIIFITVSYELQATSFIYSEQQSHGGYIALQVSGTENVRPNTMPPLLSSHLPIFHAGRCAEAVVGGGAGGGAGGGFGRAELDLALG